MSLKKIEDISFIKDAILENGNFSKKDYDILVKRALNSNYPSRLLSRLKKYIEPLISNELNLTSDIISGSSLNTEVEDNSIFEKIYKASDFEVEDGVIRLGDLILESKRVFKTSNYWLAMIKHDFIITKDRNQSKHFNFVPFTDLFYLVNAIDELIEHQLKLEETKEYERFKNQLLNITDKYISELFSLYIYCDNKNCDDFFQKLKNLGIVRDEDYTDFYAQWHETKLFVHISDIRIYDEYISINTANIDLISYFKFDSFLQYLKLNNYVCSSFLRKWENLIKQEFYRKVHAFIQQTKKNEEIEVTTHVSADTFRRVFPNINNAYYSLTLEWNPYIPDKLLIPFSFLKHKKNNGAILFKPHCLNKYDLSFSKPFSFSNEICSSFIQKVNEYRKLLDNIEHRSFCFLHDLEDLRIVTQHVGIRGIICTEKYDFVIEFDEVFSHRSDIFAYKKRKSYLLWNKLGDIIQLVTTAVNHAIYNFILREGCSSEEAAYLIIQYFSSSIENKRENFKITKEMELFGIEGFYRS